MATRKRALGRCRSTPHPVASTFILLSLILALLATRKRAPNRCRSHPVAILAPRPSRLLSSPLIASHPCLLPATLPYANHCCRAVHLHLFAPRAHAYRIVVRPPPSRCAVHALPGFTVPPLFTILCLMSLSLVIRAARPLREPMARWPSEKVSRLVHVSRRSE